MIMIEEKAIWIGVESLHSLNKIWIFWILIIIRWIKVRANQVEMEPQMRMYTKQLDKKMKKK